MLHNSLIKWNHLVPFFFPLPEKMCRIFEFHSDASDMLRLRLFKRGVSEKVWFCLGEIKTVSHKIKRFWVIRFVWPKIILQDYAKLPSLQGRKGSIKLEYLNSPVKIGSNSINYIFSLSSNLGCLSCNLIEIVFNQMEFLII